MTEQDFAPFMHEAIALAEQGRWKACPNPTVGAVLARDGRVVARGWHHEAGQDHAEVDCLKDAAARGVDPKGCTLVVTLEPCNHQGKTPPCTQAILDARALYPDCSLADLYDEVAMPPELRRAHQDNDRAVMAAYGFSVKDMTESKCVAELMRIYQKLTEK